MTAWIDPSLPLQAAIVTALRGDATMVSLQAQRVYDDVPPDPTFPYTSLGPDDAQDDPDTCIGGADTTCQVNLWSRAVGRVEAKRMLAAAVAVLDAPLIVEGHAVIIHQVQRAVVLKDPDGKTKHGLLVMRYRTAPSA
jgi:hypothetical protein